MHLHVLAQRGRVRVGLFAAVDAANVRLVGGVHVHVLLAIRAVGEASIALRELALEWLLACFCDGICDELVCFNGELRRRLVNHLLLLHTNFKYVLRLGSVH